MKKRYVAMIAVATMILGFSINNIAMSDYAGQRIAVVDVNAVVAKSAQVQKLKKEQQAKLQELDAWLKTARDDVNRQQTAEGKERLTKKYNADFAKKREVITKQYADELKKIDASISSTISSQARAQGYSLVLAKGVVLFGGDDITAAVQKVVK